MVRKWYIAPNVVLREEADEWGILFDPDTGASVALNPIAVTMFKAMQKSQSVDKVEKAVRDEFDEVPETLKDDIADLVEALAKDGFIGFQEGITDI